MLVDEPARAVDAAGLLVGEERQHDVAGWLAAGAHAFADDGERHGVHVFHVDGAAAPDVAVVADLAGERMHGPVGGFCRDDVEVAVDQQGRPAAVLAFDAGDDRCALGLGLQDGRLDPDLGELPGDVFGRAALVTVSPAAVDGFEAQQIAAQLDDFSLGARHPSIVTADRRKRVRCGLPGHYAAWVRQRGHETVEPVRRRNPFGATPRSCIELGITSRAPTCTRAAPRTQDGTGRAALPA